MAVRMISVRDKTTGSKSVIPETALRLFPNLVRAPKQAAADDAAARSDTPATKATTKPAHAGKKKES